MHNDKFRKLLLSCANNENIDRIRFLLESGAVDINAKSKWDETALHIVSSNFFEYPLGMMPQIIDVLLTAGADINALNNCNETPLHILIRRVYPDSYFRFDKSDDFMKVLKIFFKNNANFTARDHRGQTVLDIVMQSYRYGFFDVDLIRALINYGSGDLINYANSLYTCENSQDPRGRSLLHQACEVKTPELVKYLLQNGANVNALDDDNRTPLFYALSPLILDEDHRILKYLLERNPDVNVIAKDGSNILSYRFGRISCINFDTIMRHLALKQILGKSLHPSLLQTISTSKFYCRYFRRRHEEFDILIRDKISPASRLTWLNLLIDHKNKLVKYAKNQSLVLEFINTDLIKKYPVSGIRIERRFSKAIEHREILPKSAITLGTCLPSELGTNHIIVNKILSFFKLKDLRILCKTK